MGVAMPADHAPGSLCGKTASTQRLPTGSGGSPRTTCSWSSRGRLWGDGEVRATMASLFRATCTGTRHRFLLPGLGVALWQFAD